MPTAQRAPAAFLLRRGGERLLFDCAEGTQRQLQRSAVGLADLEEIFLTHLHADHFLGLPGMLKTFALRGREEPGLTVYGPRGVKDLFAKLRPFLGRLPYPLTTVELEPGESLERGEYRIEPFAVDPLVHAATVAAEEAERARETMHATAVEAAEVARLAEVRLLALTHVSTRYFGPELAREAREVFAETVVPRDFDLIEVPFPERG